VAVDANGNAVVTGVSLAVYNGSGEFYTVKYAAANGALLWEKRGPVGDPRALALDHGGNVVVTGSSAGNGHGEYYTAKYAAADGALLWERRYHGPAPASQDNQATAVVVDGGGNVVVTGASAGANGTTDCYTAKYAAADGALLWEQRYGGPAGRGDSGTAVAVDRSGNVVVTGYSDATSTTDYYTAKYAAADGTLLWGRRYENPQNSHGQATALAVDNSGDVVVTGFSMPRTSSYFDFATVKYAAADGALLWEKRYDGPAKLNDFASAVAVDGHGNIVVTGYSDNGTVFLSNYGYYTAKYAAADGALLWEKRYHGLADGDNSLVNSRNSLALGPNGMVVVAGGSSGDYATVVYRDIQPLVSIDRVPTGVRIRSPGLPGQSYEIERAVATAGPWNTLATPTATPDGLVEYVDTNPPPATAFYRVGAP